MTPKEAEFLKALAARIRHARIMDDIDAANVLDNIVANNQSSLHIPISFENFNREKVIAHFMTCNEDTRHVFCLGLASGYVILNENRPVKNKSWYQRLFGF